jgi:hypothetical protein
MKSSGDMLPKLEEHPSKFPVEPITALQELGLEVICGNGGPGGAIFVIGCAKTPERAASINQLLAELVQNAARVPGLEAQVASIPDLERQNEELRAQLRTLTSRLEALELRLNGSINGHAGFLPPSYTVEEHPGHTAD